MTKQEFINRLIVDVCELPDRNSPADQPDMMLVTGKELEALVSNLLECHAIVPVEISTRAKLKHEPMAEDMAVQMKPAEDAIRARAVNGRVTGTTSFVQRTLQCGYNRAAAILDVMVERGIITEPDKDGARYEGWCRCGRL